MQLVYNLCYFAYQLVTIQNNQTEVVIMVSVYFQKFLLGLSLAAPIGPVTLEMIRRGLGGGFWQAFVIRLGGAIANTLCLLAAFWGLSQLNDVPYVTPMIGLTGSLLLAYMGIQSLCRSRFIVPSTQAKSSLVSGLGLGVSLGLFNPVGIVFWFGVSASNSLPNLTADLMIIVGVISWGALLATILTCLKQWITPKSLYLINLLSGMTLLFFAFNTAQNFFYF